MNRAATVDETVDLKPSLDVNGEADKEKNVAWRAFSSLRSTYSSLYHIENRRGTARDFITRAYAEMGYRLEGFCISSPEDVIVYLSKLICTDVKTESQFNILQSISRFYYLMTESEEYGGRHASPKKEIITAYNEIMNMMAPSTHGTHTQSGL